MGGLMLIDYAWTSAMAWNIPQGRIYSYGRSNPRCGLLRKRGVETNKVQQRSPRLGLQ
jgi:hypothetical protein